MMKKTLVFMGVVMCICVAAVHAQQPSLQQHAKLSSTELRATEAIALVGEQSIDMMSTVKAKHLVAPKGRSSVTEETVGDPYSFGRYKTYLGVVQVGSVHLQADCSTFPPNPSSRCIETDPAPAVTIVDEADMGVIELPANATNSILCFTFTPFAQWQWVNETGSPQTAYMFLRPAVRIESEVLDDPALLDPNTGLPFNGVLFDSTISTFLQMRTLQPNEFDYQFHATTRTCTAGLLNTRTLRDNYGLSETVIKDFFKSPITVSFGIRGRVSMIENASYSVGVRLYGD